MNVLSKWTAKLRVTLARHRWIRWVIVALAASLAGLFATQRVAVVDAERDAWGTTVDVVVARADLAAGDSIDGATTVHTEPWPAALVPASALREVPADARLRQRVNAGEALTEADISSGVGPASLADEGTAVVGISDALARNATVGLDVQVSSEGIVLAAHATVVEVTDDVTYVAVAIDDAPAVAAAAQAGFASLIFLP